MRLSSHENQDIFSHECSRENPWVGGFLSAAATYKTEEASLRQNQLQTQWLEEHQKKIFVIIQQK